MRKEFDGLGGEKVIAVNDVTMNIYEGQIFALLGHNVPFLFAFLLFSFFFFFKSKKHVYYDTERQNTYA